MGTLRIRDLDHLLSSIEHSSYHFTHNLDALWTTVMGSKTLADLVAGIFTGVTDALYTVKHNLQTTWDGIKSAGQFILTQTMNLIVSGISLVGNLALTMLGQILSTINPDLAVSEGNGISLTSGNDTRNIQFQSKNGKLYLNIDAYSLDIFDINKLVGVETLGSVAFFSSLQADLAVWIPTIFLAINQYTLTKDDLKFKGIVFGGGILNLLLEIMDTKQRIGSPNIISDLSSKLGYFVGMVLGISLASQTMGGLTDAFGPDIKNILTTIGKIALIIQSITLIPCSIGDEYCPLAKFSSWFGGASKATPKSYVTAMLYLISLYVSETQMDQESFLYGVQYGAIIGFILAMMTDHIARELSYDFLTRITVKQFFVILIISNLVKVISTAYDLKMVSGG